MKRLINKTNERVKIDATTYLEPLSTMLFDGEINKSVRQLANMHEVEIINISEPIAIQRITPSIKNEMTKRRKSSPIGLPTSETKKVVKKRKNKKVGGK